MSVIQNALTDLLGWLKPAWEFFARLAATLWHRAVQLWLDVRDRHDRLMDDDPRYPVALATGGTAVVKVVITNPAVVKALGVLLTELLDVQDERPRAITQHSPYRSPTRRDFGPSPWSSSQLASPLWDRDDWDDEQ